MRPKNKSIIIRLSEFDKNRIKMLADRYAKGNVTAWILHGALNAPRENIKIKGR